MLMVIPKPGGIDIVGGGPGGTIPGGFTMTQPNMSRSSHRMQIVKNHKLQGMTVPVSVGLGSSTGVVTGMIQPPSADDSVVVVGGAVTEASVDSGGFIVVTCPSDKVETTPPEEATSVEEAIVRLVEETDEGIDSSVLDVGVGSPLVAVFSALLFVELAFVDIDSEASEDLIVVT